MRAVAIILLFMSSITAGAEIAETIFINGNIYTVNETQPHAEAIAVHRDRIIFVGSNADAEKFRATKRASFIWPAKPLRPVSPIRIATFSESASARRL